MNEKTLDASVEPVESVVDQPITMDDTNVESSPTSEENHEEKSNGVHKRINTLTAQKYEQQRRADGLQAELDNLKVEKPAEVVVAPSSQPQLPDDMYDQEAMRKYLTDTTAYNLEAAQSAAKKTFEDHRQAGTVAHQQAEMQKVVSTYANNAVRDGVDMDKLRAAEQVLNQSGMSPELGQFIMNDSNGGKIAEYLHDNPSALHDVLSVDPISAGHKILTEIKPRALSTTPRVSNAPEPIPEIRGGGAVDKDDFERTNPGTTFI
jgi:hypothetical protein